MIENQFKYDKCGLLNRLLSTTLLATSVYLFVNGTSLSLRKRWLLYVQRRATRLRHVDDGGEGGSKTLENRNKYNPELNVLVPLLTYLKNAFEILIPKNKCLWKHHA